MVFCPFVSACDIAFSMSLPVFSYLALYACVTSVISSDTLFVRFFLIPWLSYWIVAG